MLSVMEGAVVSSVLFFSMISGINKVNIVPFPSALSN